MPIDYRIHSSLNCGAKSCPPIRIYTINNLEKGLNLGLKNFCNNEIEIKNNIVYFNKIFYWYGNDFGKNIKEQLNIISQYCNDNIKNKLNQISKVINKDNINTYIKYNDYDWSQNS